MAKYKVGDKVKIVPDRVYGMNVCGGMDKYLGTIMTIADVVHFVRRDYYKMEEDKGEWYWLDNMIECKVDDVKEDDNMSAKTLDKANLEKGIDGVMVQDTFRAVKDKTTGMIGFNPVKMVNLTFVKFDGNDKVYMFRNPSDKRLKKGTKVKVDSAGMHTEATVVSSIKIAQKYLTSLQMAMCDGRTPELKDVVGVYQTKKIEVTELVDLSA